MNAGEAIKGWCPGALRPMPSGDGLIVRVRLSCGELSTALAAEIAEWAESYGNGIIDLSARGNLQIRGVSEATWRPLVEQLSARGLIDASAEAEAVRNVLVAPFAGFLPDAFDVRPTARALEAALGRDPSFWRLPGKFGFSIDAGSFPLGDVGADVAFEAADDGTFRLRLSGAEDRPLGPLPEDRVVATALEVAAQFLAAHEDPTVRRLRDLVRKVGVEALSQRLGVPLAGAAPPPPARPLRDLLGYREGFVGVGLPFGRTRARDLGALAKLAASAGAASLRLTPWRAILVLGVAPALLRALGDLNVILTGDDPRLAVVACPGAPDCASGSIPAREVAQALAPLLAGAGDAALHVSGCAKGCAHPRAAPVTVVGRNARFDVVLDGRADAAPERSGLDREALAAYLARRFQPVEMGTR